MRWRYNACMRRIFLDTRRADSLCREKFSLGEDIMMENAAAALEKEVRACLKERGPGAVTVLCGPGNNGADGYALARRLSAEKDARAVEVMAAKSAMCVLQKERALASGARILPPEEALEGCACVVDCVFGSGFHGKIPDDVSALIEKVNAMSAAKISCDIPTGLDPHGNACGAVFRADRTVTMGVLKLALYGDYAKDFCGEVVSASLGVSDRNFENCALEAEKESGSGAEFWLLEREDMVLPHRKSQNVNKGSFGHAAFVCGEKEGAAFMAAGAALRFGAGLCTVVSQDFKYNADVPHEIRCEVMRGGAFPDRTTAVGLGMGLGRSPGPFYDWLLKNSGVPCVLDADAFYYDETAAFLRRRAGTEGAAGVVLTPHPKEFASLLRLCGLGEFSVAECVLGRVDLVREFCSMFPGVTLVLKGANVIIARNSSLFINAEGTSALSKAGSGDVLTGLITALLAQGRGDLDSAITASLAHAVAARGIKNDFSLTPFRLIDAVCGL